MCFVVCHNYSRTLARVLFVVSLKLIAVNYYRYYIYKFTYTILEEPPQL